MTRPEVIRKRLSGLEEYLEHLERLGQHDHVTFNQTPEYYGSAERFLQLAIEAVNDMAGHIIAEMELGTVDQYRDLAAHFHNQGWIEDEMLEKWIKMIGLRNILVHDYLEVDRTMIHQVLQEDLEDLKKLRGVFARFI